MIKGAVNKSRKVGCEKLNLVFHIPLLSYGIFLLKTFLYCADILNRKEQKMKKIRQNTWREHTV